MPIHSSLSINPGQLKKMQPVDKPSGAILHLHKHKASNSFFAVSPPSDDENSPSLAAVNTNEKPQKPLFLNKGRRNVTFMQNTAILTKRKMQVDSNVM